ncbi:hypothetical protein [Thalassospira lucentensis]|uniref:hypothetical protein n=1 Tax=Thalassospira lucentensis TaxID=168935 RepID=UPI00399D63B7
MHSDSGATIPVCQDWTRKIPRQPDGEAFVLHCTGGLRAIEHEKKSWHIEPVFDDKAPSAKGFMSKETLNSFLNQNNYSAIAFQSINWSKGKYHSRWSPIISGQSNHFQSPADLWGNIASNLSKARISDHYEKAASTNLDEIAAVLDSTGEIERFARSISLSLRNMDISIEQIVAFYNDQLIHLMASGHIRGERSSTSSDQTLFAHVNSFFMHFGAARDYLASLIAERMYPIIAKRLNKSPKIDSLGKLVGNLHPSDVNRDNLIRMLHSKTYIAQNPENEEKFMTSGWLANATSLRNTFTHHRPFGDRFVEQSGYAQVIDENSGLYQYHRPLVSDDGEADALSVIAHHYQKTVALFFNAAFESGYDTNLLKLTDNDIISKSNRTSKV